MMLGSKASWVPLDAGADDMRAEAYPKCSIQEWHQRFTSGPATEPAVGADT